MRQVIVIIEDGLPEPARVVIDPVESDLVDMRERSLLKAWQRAKFRRGRLPRRSDLGDGLLSSIEGFLIDLDLDADGSIRFRTYGRSIAAAFGRDMTGKNLNELPGPDSRLFLKVYSISGSRRVPCATQHVPSVGVKVGTWLRVVLPLDERSTGAVTGFLACNVPLDSEHSEPGQSLVRKAKGR